MEQGVAARSGEVQLVPLVSIFSPLFFFFFFALRHPQLRVTALAKYFQRSQIL